MRLDAIDCRLLWNLDYSARLPLSKLAAKTGISKQNASYRLSRLFKEGVLLGCMALVDVHKLGYCTYRVYFRQKGASAGEEKLVAKLKSHPNVLWLAQLAGSWDVEAVFVAKNSIHFNNMLKKIKEEFGGSLYKCNVSASIVNYHFKRDYLVGRERGAEFKPKYYGFEPIEERLDELDLGVLSELSRNCRQSSNEIGRKLGVSYHTVKQRTLRLEQNGVIQGYRILLDLGKIGRKYCKAAVKLGNPSKEQEEQLYKFCSQFNTVVYLVEVLGEWQLEIEAEVQEQDEFIEILRAIRSKFPNLILDYEVFRVSKERKLNYFPMGKSLLVQFDSSMK